MKDRTIGVILLVLFLLVFGLLHISNFHFDLENFVLGALAIGASVFLLIGK